jgi:hypothetical protein
MELLAAMIAATLVVIADFSTHNQVIGKTLTGCSKMLAFSADKRFTEYPFYSLNGQRSKLGMHQHFP